MTPDTTTPHIGLLATSLNGGIGKRLTNLSRGFKALGVRVTVYLEKFDGPFTEDMADLATLRPWPSTHPVTGGLALARRLKLDQPDALLAQNIRLAHAALVAQRLSRWRGQIGVNIPNTYSVQFQELSDRKRRRRISKLRRLLPRVDRVIPVCEDVGKDLVSLTGIPADNVTPILSSVDLDAIAAHAAQPVPDPDWWQAGPVILGLGRLEQAKSFDVLIRAFAQLKKDTPCRLAIVGDGSLRTQLEALAASALPAEDYRFFGHQQNPYRFLKRAAVFVLSSRNEGFANVMLEAFACGTPIVATNCPSGPRELLEDGRWGRLVEVGDIEGLAKAMAESLHAGPAPPPVDYVRQNYGIQAVAGRYLAALGMNPAAETQDE